MLTIIIAKKAPWSDCIASKCFILCSCLRYYYDNEDVQNDAEFQEYLHELSGHDYGKVSVKSRIAVAVCLLFS